MSDRPVLRRDPLGSNEIPEISSGGPHRVVFDIGQLYAIAGQPLYYRKRSLQKIGKRFTSDLLEHFITSPD
jgi:hypothetical protein